MERIDDLELEKAILGIMNQLHKQEEVSKIDIVLVKDMVNLGLTIIDKDKERHWGTCRSFSHILVNIKVKTMLENEDEKDIVYAILAHEIGHIMSMEDKYFEIEETAGCILEWEIESDKKALMLLGNIYDNPKDILLKQINYVRKRIYDCEDAKIDIHLTTELAEKGKSL